MTPKRLFAYKYLYYSKMSEGRYKYLIIVLLSIFTMVLQAQNDQKGTTIKNQKTRRVFTPVNQMAPVDKSGVEKLSFADRLAIRTNMVDWALLIPNIGVEFDVRNTNWNRWTVGANVRYNWQTSHTYKPSFVYNLFQARLEGRQYWRTRDMRRRKLERHNHFWDKAISIRRKRAKHPATTWYRGVFVAYNKYSFLFGGNGHQGTSYMAGITYGIIRPMFAFENGNSLDLEFGASVGAVYYKDDVYRHDADKDSYVIVEQKPAQLLKFPMVNEIRVGLVYRLGHAPVLSKYRYRRDVDMDYHSRLDSIHTSHVTLRNNKQNYEKTREMIERRFWHVYDSIVRIDKQKQFKGIPEENTPPHFQVEV